MVVALLAPSIGAPVTERHFVALPLFWEQFMSAKYEPEMGSVIFSLVDETVLVSWHGNSASIELGSSEAVTSMMRDFLAQCELGDQLAHRAASND